MSFAQDMYETGGRFKKYKEQLIALFKQHEIKSIKQLIYAFRNNEAF